MTPLKDIDRNRSPKLQANVVEDILVACIKGCSFYDLNIKMDNPSMHILKIYLFYLIDYSIISYKGNNHIFVTESEGIDLLCHIYKEKTLAMVDSKDMLIYIE